MEIVKFIYKDQEIEFELGQSNLMVNATEMAKIFETDVFQFTRIDNTKLFISECLKPQNCGLLGIEKEEDLIISRQKTGTWMHRILALKFAAWLSPEFEVWVYITIDKILNLHFKEQKQAMIESLTAKQQKKLKKEEILAKYSNLPEIAEYFELDTKEKEALKKRQAAIRNQVKQLKFEFKF